MLVVVRLTGEQINRQTNSGKLTVLVAVRLTVDQTDSDRLTLLVAMLSDREQTDRQTVTYLLCWLLLVPQRVGVGREPPVT